MFSARALPLRWWLGGLVVTVSLPLVFLFTYLYSSEVERERATSRAALHPPTAIEQRVGISPGRERLIQGIIIVSLMIVGFATLAMIVSREITRPMKLLASAAAAAARGNFSPVPAVQQPREMVALAAAFNQMVEMRSTAEKRMAEDERKLKALSDRLLEIQEDERARIARELHDDLGQALTALKMDVTGLVQLVGTEALAPLADRILKTIDQTVTSVQRISSELRPSVLDDLGLFAALEDEARLFEERSGIECELSLNTQRQVSGSMATTVYRIAQEALTNVARHSDATRVEIRIRQVAEELLLDIRDDGKGVTLEQIDNEHSLGLIGIRERADLLGGIVHIEGFPGRGTIVSVRLPFEEEERS
jgi:signal transduction histidine kinase